MPLTRSYHQSRYDIDIDNEPIDDVPSLLSSIVEDQTASLDAPLPQLEQLEMTVDEELDADTESQHAQVESRGETPLEVMRELRMDQTVESPAEATVIEPSRRQSEFKNGLISSRDAHCRQEKILRHGRIKHRNNEGK